MKIRFMGVLTVLLVCLILVGCVGGKHAKANDEMANEPVVLTFMMPQTHDKDFLQGLLKEYEKENPGCQIEVQRIPDNQWIDLVKSKAAVGEMPDMIRIDRGLLEEVGTDHFVEFDEKESWYDRIKEEQKVNKEIDGHLFGLPIGSVSSIGIIYNSEIFERLNLSVPHNMEEFRAVCERLKKEGLIPLYASDKDSWTTPLFFSCMAVQLTENHLWERLLSNQVKWSEVPEFETMLNEIVALYKAGYTNPDYLEATYDGAVDAFAAGKAAMYTSGQFFIQDVIKKNPEREVMMMPVPYDNKDLLTIISGPGMFAVSKDSEHIEQARHFLEWFSMPDHMDVFNKGWSHMPVFKDQKMVLNSWQQFLYDNYISKNKTVSEIGEVLSGINKNEFWNNQREMLAGRMTARQVLEEWDLDFAEQMKFKGKTGW
ncbi:Multiple sugar-binding protein precursor [Clostridium sp. C105KSO15]|nr:Multiple sugar-binding protein precursor [Clostridium sp. C105KSO15]